MNATVAGSCGSWASCGAAVDKRPRTCCCHNHSNSDYDYDFDFDYDFEFDSDYDADTNFDYDYLSFKNVNSPFCIKLRSMVESAV